MKEYDEINEQPMLLEIWSTVTRLPAECWQVFDDDVITEEYYDNIATETTTQQMMDTNYDKLNANQWYHLADITDKRMKLIPDFATNPMNDKNARLYWEEAMEDSYQKISKVVRDNEKNQASGRYRTAKAIKDLMEVVKDPDFMEYIKQDASLMFSMSQTFASIPKPMFKKTEVVNGETVYVTGENGKPVYEVDLEKYDKLMSDYNFISMFEEKIKFCKEHTIPYVKAKKEDRLNEKMIADYKQAYSEHMAEQSRMAQEVTNINENDPLIKDNYTFNVDADLVQKRWKSAYAGNQIKRAHQDQIYLSNGWPVQDLAVLREIEDNYSKLEVIAEGGSKAQKAEAKAKIKLLKNDMKELRSAKVESQVDRNKILKKFDELAIRTRDNEQDSLSPKIQRALSEKADAREYGFGATAERMKEWLDEEYESDRALKEAQEKNGPVKPKHVFRFDKDATKKMIEDLSKSIDKVDYFMFGKSSDEFNKMKESFDDLKEYANKRFISGRKVKMEDISELVEMANKTMNKISIYLDHKTLQFDQDKTRKDSEDKQKREQPRIKASIAAFETLNNYVTGLEAEFVRSCKEEIRSKISERLKAEEAIRNDPNTSNSDYNRSVLRSIDMTQKMDQSYFNRLSGESFEQFTNRLLKAPNMEYTDNYLMSLKNQDAVNDIYMKLMHKGPGKKADAPERHPEDVTNDKIKEAYNAKLKIKSNSVLREREIAQYKENLVAKPKPEKEVAKKAVKAPKA